MDPRSLPFSPRLPPLPDSPLSSASSRSPPSISFHQPSPMSMSMSPSSPSNSYSHYQSPLPSPTCSRDSSAGSAAIRLDTTTDEEEEESSSDVEIYLSSLGINDSAASISLSQSRSQPFVFSQQQCTSPQPPIDDSPVLPSHFQAQQAQPLTTSPQLPPAPSQHTIPLPAVFSPKQRPAYPFSQNPAPSASSSASAHEAPAPDALDPTGKTPNVYINGLPPHFPEDQLFALAAPFGAVRSVRTFTRHVRDSESGYGFVLFETVEAAEKCIISLRRYRNLHPTFSKQAHKIPGSGTAAAQAPLNLPLTIHLDTASASWYGGSECDGGDGGSASFKAKMESLHDRTSTNLYMEGLPLSIDEPTLGALVSPHRISSSRFFQTRLSNPPRIIAFVRFETRTGAEEIIERLHGRMVRGWNDTGSRISVRFADTAEQRELRRNERMTREGEESPARLTIAQAALLNLRGQDLRTKGPLPQPPPALRIPTPQQLFPDYSPAARAHTPPFSVDYSLAGRHAYPHPHPHPHPHERTHTPVHHHPLSPYHTHAEPLTLPPPPMDPTMAALLESLRSSGTPFPSYGAGTYQDAAHPHSHNAGLNHFSSNRSEYADVGGVPFGTQHLQARPHSRHQHQHLHQHQVPRSEGRVQARSGYTATEEFIMRAHADSAAQQQQQQQKRRPAPPPLDLVRRRRDSEASAANIGVGARAYRAQAQVQYTSPSLGVIPLVSEEEFHATASGQDEFGRASGGGGEGRDVNVPGAKHNHRIHPAHVNARLAREHPQMEQNQNQNQQSQSQNASPNPSLYNMHHYQQAHLRSSTLPHRAAPAAASTRHYQHSSMSIPSSNQLQSQGQNTYSNNVSQHLHQHSTNNNNNNSTSNTNSNSNNNNNNNTNKNSDVTNAIGIYDSDAARAEGILSPTTNGNNNNIGIHYEKPALHPFEHAAPRYHHPNHHQNQHRNQHQPHNNHNHNRNHSQGQHHHQHHHNNNNNNLGAYDADSSPSLISPALTYSSQHSQTPSTLSPATPFFSSFAAGGGGTPQEGFERAGGGQAVFEPGKKIRAGSH